MRFCACDVQKNKQKNEMFRLNCLLVIININLQILQYSLHITQSGDRFSLCIKKVHGDRKESEVILRSLDRLFRRRKSLYYRFNYPYAQFCSKERLFFPCCQHISHYIDFAETDCFNTDFSMNIRPHLLHPLATWEKKQFPFGLKRESPYHILTSFSSL